MNLWRWADYLQKHWQEWLENFTPEIWGSRREIFNRRWHYWVVDHKQVQRSSDISFLSGGFCVHWKLCRFYSVINNAQFSVTHECTKGVYSWKLFDRTVFNNCRASWENDYIAFDEYYNEPIRRSFGNCDIYNTTITWLRNTTTWLGISQFFLFLAPNFNILTTENRSRCNRDLN